MKKLLLTAVFAAMISATGANAADRIYTLPVLPENTATWSEITDVIKTMLVSGGGQKGNVAVSRSSGLITVAGADDDAIARIDAFIDQMTRAMSRNVSIQIKVVEIDGANGPGLAAAMKQMGAKGNATYSPTYSTSSGEEAAIINGIYTVNGTDDAKILSALSAHGKVTTITSASAVGGNPATPLKVVTEQGRLSTAKCAKARAEVSCSVSVFQKDEAASRPPEFDTHKVRDIFQVTLKPADLVDSNGTLLTYTLAVSLKDGDKFEGTGLVNLPKGQTMVLPYGVASGKQAVILLSASEI